MCAHALCEAQVRLSTWRRHHRRCNCHKMCSTRSKPLLARSMQQQHHHPYWSNQAHPGRRGLRVVSIDTVYIFIIAITNMCAQILPVDRP